MRHLTGAFALCAFLAACGGGGGSSGSNGTPAPSPAPTPAPAPGAGASTVSGKITYDHVPITLTGNQPRLNYGGTTQRPVRSVVVEAVDAGSQAILATGNTNTNGDYTLSLPSGRSVFIRAKAKMVVSGSNAADISVIDNTSNGAQWALVGATFTSTAGATTQNLNAPSGWTGSGYDNTRRSAGPFAIIDTIYQATQKIISVDSTVSFPKLNINWSPNNITASGNLALGQIGTSFFTGISGGSSVRQIYILGAANNDTDEYDDHVVAHEFGHYLQDVFSRDDTISGPHGGNDDRLDMRVAFSEGWGNAWSAIALANPIYSDTSGAGQATGDSFDVRVGESSNAGWFKESSVERVFWDLSNTAAVGFGPVWNTMKTGLKTSPALTSIHAFARALVTSAPGTSGAVQTVLGNPNIAIALPTSPYAENETNFGNPVIANLSPIYMTYSGLGSNLANICVGTAADPTLAGNKAGSFRYIRLPALQGGSRTFTLTRTSSTTANSDPDFVLYDSQGFRLDASSAINNSETATTTLSTGDYVLAVTDFNQFVSSGRNSSACFTLTVR